MSSRKSRISSIKMEPHQKKARNSVSQNHTPSLFGSKIARQMGKLKTDLLRQDGIANVDIV